MPNMRQIARLAGVSLGTVSMALRNDSRVRLATRVRIHALAEKYGYLPNRPSRDTSKSGLLGVVLHHPLGPFYASLLQGVLKQAYQDHLQVVVNQLDNSSSANAMMAAESLLEQHVEGIVFAVALGELLPRDLLLEIRSAGVAPVCVMENKFVAPCDCVTSSEDEQAHLIADYLWQLGHRDIAYIGIINVSSVHRFAALETALKRAGLKCSFQFNSDAPQGYASALTALRHATPRPTAVVAYNDLVAGYLLQYALRQGMHIPHDLSIVGFGDSYGDLLIPKLTTVEQFPELIGSAAVALIRKRAGMLPSVTEYVPETSCIPPRLLVRESSGPVAKA